MRGKFLPRNEMRTRNLKSSKDRDQGLEGFHFQLAHYFILLASFSIALLADSNTSLHSVGLSC